MGCPGQEGDHPILFRQGRSYQVLDVANTAARQEKKQNQFAILYCFGAYKHPYIEIR